MSQFVSTFPPPPAHYLLFREQTLKPPAATGVCSEEAYGGTLTTARNPLSKKRKREGEGKEGEEEKEEEDVREQLRRALKAYTMNTIQFITDKSSIKSFDQEAIRIEQESTRLYELLQNYRKHEAREKLCQEMRSQVADLVELRDSLSSALKEATAIYGTKPLASPTE